MKAYTLFLIFLTILAVTPVLAQPYNLTIVNWVKYIKFSGNDHARGTCIFGEYLAVVGDAGGGPTLVLLDRSTGYIVRRWIGEHYETFPNCFSTGNVLYAVGGWWGAIYAFDKDLNLLNKAESPSDSWFSSITYDGEYLYIGGSVGKGMNFGETWYIEKRTKSLKLISCYNIRYASWLYHVWNWKHGWISDLGINPVTGELWAVGGYEDIDNKTHSLLFIFDKELRELKKVDYPEGNEYYLGWLCGICFDNIGNAYVKGWRGVAKFDKNGNILKVNKKVNKDVSAGKITFINGLVYVFVEEYMGDYRGLVLYVLNSELNVIEKYLLYENVNENSYFEISRLSFDGHNVYVAGYDYAYSGSRWVVYSVALPLIRVTIEGLPSSYTVSVYIDENLVGYIQGGDNKTFEVDKERVKVRVEPSEIRTNDIIYKVANDTLTINSGEEAVFRYYAKYPVYIDGVCNFYEKGSTIPAQQDIPTLGGLIIKRFEGYLDPYGNNLGKSIVVNGPLTLSSYYREEINLPLLSIIIVVVLVSLFVLIRSKSKKEQEERTVPY